jgi:hypothetical protein
MATQDVIDFHRGAQEINRQRLLNKIAYDSAKGDRRMNPQFKGLIPNSTGSRNAPFLTHTNQARLPFEPPVAGGAMYAGAGNAGALFNPAGRQYAKAILQRRAMDIMAQQEMLPEPTALPSEEVPLTVVEAQKDELRTLLQSIQIAATSQRATLDITTAIQRASLLLTKVGAFMDMDELEELDEVLGELQNLYETDAARDVGGPEGAFSTGFERKTIESTTALTTIIIKMREYVSGMLSASPTLTEKERKLLSSNVKKDVGIGRTLKRLSAPIAERVKGRVELKRQVGKRAAQQRSIRAELPPLLNPTGDAALRQEQARLSRAQGEFLGDQLRAEQAGYFQRAQNAAREVADVSRRQRELAARAPAQQRPSASQQRRMNEMAAMIAADESTIRQASFSGRQAAQSLAERLARR